MSNIGKTSAKAIRHEWQLDALAAATTANALFDADDASAVAASPTTRASNMCQIMGKTVIVGGTLDAVDKAGRKSELAYQLAKRSKELKRDTEKILLANQASVLGTDSVARKLGGFPSWLTSNVSRAADGTSGGYSTSTALTIAATDTTGSGRTFTETLLKTVQQSCKTNGGHPTILSLNVYNKGQFSNATNFPGIATLRTNVKQNSEAATVIGAADVYLGDFGALQVVVDIFQREQDALLYDPEYLALAWLRPTRQYALAKTGDSEKRQIIQECTLECRNEAAHGVVADLKTA